MARREAWRLQRASEAGARRVLKLGADAATTIAARAPMLNDPASTVHRAELTRMIMEKPPAFADAAVALAGKAPYLLRPWQRYFVDQSKLGGQLVATMAQAGSPTAALGAQQAWLLGTMKLVTRLGLELSAVSVAGLSASMVPLHRRARANARRLGSNKSKG